MSSLAVSGTLTYGWQGICRLKHRPWTDHQLCHVFADRRGSILQHRPSCLTSKHHRQQNRLCTLQYQPVRFISSLFRVLLLLEKQQVGSLRRNVLQLQTAITKHSNAVGNCRQAVALKRGNLPSKPLEEPCCCWFLLFFGYRMINWVSLQLLLEFRIRGK